MSSPFRHRIPIAVLATLALLAGLVPLGVARGETPPDHLVVSEVVTGGASASDELIELHNPTAGPLPLEGLEVVYVTSSGATISRRAAWPLGAPSVAAGGHVLVANEAGAYAGIADATYASGMASTGGSVAIRIQSAATAIDAVGWGATTSAWREGAPAPAPAAGSSIERRPGGPDGSSVDTDDNAADFVIRDVPGPQNLASPPTPDPGAVTPSAVPSDPADPTASPGPGTPAPATPTPTSQPTSSPVSSIAVARGLPDGTAVTVEGVALAGSDFTEGGGTVVDASGGIAVLVDGGAFARGDRVALHGTVDDRYSQRTLRVAATGIEVIGAGGDPTPESVTTGMIGESTEGRLVRVSGEVLGAPTALTTGLAFDVDDGTGAVRVLVGSGTGIDTGSWETRAVVTVVGLAGQRDSSGSGTSGYRVLPRDPADVVEVRPPAPPTATPAASVSPGASASPTASGAPSGVTSVAGARALPKNARVRIRGTVTMPTGLVDEATAVVEDATGAIVLRLGAEAGTLSLGAEVEVDGTRSTKGGMETLRVTVAPRVLGSAGGPTPRLVRTGQAGEAEEARLVTVRGTVVASARRASSGAVSFEIDDGSGPLRVAVPAVLEVDAGPFTADSWVEVTGVLGQETTGAQPLRGYRVWPRSADDLRLTPATETDGAGAAGSARSSDGADDATPLAGLGALEGGGPVDGPIGATIVTGPWPELGVGGILWDGERVMAVSSSDGPRIAGLLAAHGTPLPVALSGVTAAGGAEYGLSVVRLGPDADDVAIAEAPPAPPATSLSGDAGTPTWISVVGRHVATADGHRLLVDRSAGFDVEAACRSDEPWPAGVVAVRGIAAPRADADVVVPCDGIEQAPSLRGSLDTGSAAGPTTRSASRAATASNSAPTRPVPAAALFAAAAVGLAGSAALAWRRREADAGSPDPRADADASDEEPDRPGEIPAAPVLTLVPLPHERAP